MKRAFVIVRRLVLSCAFAALLSACGRMGGDQAAGNPAGNDSDTVSLVAFEERLAHIESTLERVSDYRAVLDKELEYTRGLDRHDEKLIDGAFWADAQASYGTRIEIDRLAEWANESHAAYAAHQHHVTGLSLEIDGDVAHEEGYIIFSSDMARDTRFDADGAATPGRVPPGTHASLGTGRYVNRYERRHDEWKMRVHEYVHEISMRLEAVDLCAVGCLGRWDTSDVSYLRPLQPLSAEERSSRARQGKSPRASFE